MGEAGGTIGSYFVFPYLFLTTSSLFLILLGTLYSMFPFTFDVVEPVLLTLAFDPQTLAKLNLINIQFD